MIICPNCNAENADTANHCGNCGNRLTKGSGQKTMFGFAAVTPEAMKEAAEQAKAAAAAQNNDAPADAPAGSALPKPSLPKLGGAGGGGGLPKPSLPPLGGGSGLPTPGGAAIPSPNVQAPGDSAKTEMLDSVPGPGDAPVEAGIQQNFGAPEPAAEPNPFASTAPPGESDLRPPTDLDAPAAAPEASGGFGAPAPSTEPSGGFGPAPSTEPSGGFGSPMAQPEGSGGFGGAPLSPETQPEMDVPSAAPMAASPMDSSPGGMPQAAPNNPMQPGGGFGGGGGGFGGGGNYQRGEVKDPIKIFVLIMVTCGFYALIWFHNYMGDLNKGLGEERFVFMKEFGLTIITCGLWGYWLWWRVANSTVELQEKWGVQPVMDPIILIVTMILGVGPFFLQQSLNNAWENGNPPA